MSIIKFTYQIYLEVAKIVKTDSSHLAHSKGQTDTRQACKKHAVTSSHGNADYKHGTAPPTS